MLIIQLNHLNHIQSNREAHQNLLVAIRKSIVTFKMGVLVIYVV